MFEHLLASSPAQISLDESITIKLVTTGKDGCCLLGLVGALNFDTRYVSTLLCIIICIIPLAASTGLPSIAINLQVYRPFSFLHIPITQLPHIPNSNQSLYFYSSRAFDSLSRLQYRLHIASVRLDNTFLVTELSTLAFSLRNLPNLNFSTSTPQSIVNKQATSPGAYRCQNLHYLCSITYGAQQASLLLLRALLLTLTASFQTHSRSQHTFTTFVFISPSHVD